MKTASGFAYQYNLSDHLGNVRVVLNQDKSVAQSTNYYPFGLAHATSALEKNKYLYNGKEIQSDVIGGTAFGMLDYGARFYDPVIGRWHSIDPLASKYAGLSGYNYGLNNPVMMIDPDGQDPDIYLDLYKGQVESIEGYKDLTNQAKIYLAGEDATIGDIENALSKRNYEYRKDASAPGGFLVDTDKQYRGWAMLHVLSPDNLGTVLGLGAMGAGQLASKGDAVRSILPSFGKGAKGGYDSFNAFKAVYGSAGAGNAWHHIVEQGGNNVSRFGAKNIHNVNNLIKLPHGKGSIHAQISGFYSSKNQMSGDLTVRQWLRTQSYQQQYDFRIKTLKQFGWKP